MAKEDHWFKFFYRQFVLSTQGWKDDEVGAYIRLLINQFDRGGLPDDPEELAKLITSYKKNWPMLFKKFKKGEDGLLRNDFMRDIRDERDRKSNTNKENGRRGGSAKARRSNTESEAFAKQTLSKDISSSLSSSLEKEEGGVGGETFLVPQMMQYWKLYNPQYAVDQDIDFPALFAIACKIKDWKQISGPVEDHSDPILKSWNELSTHIRFDDHLSKYSLSQIKKHFQSVIQSFNHGTGTHKQPNPKDYGKHGKSAGVIRAGHDLADELGIDISGGKDS